jgi:hypothetical protein
LKYSSQLLIIYALNNEQSSEEWLELFSDIQHPNYGGDMAMEGHANDDRRIENISLWTKINLMHLCNMILENLYVR